MVNLYESAYIQVTAYPGNRAVGGSNDGRTSPRRDVHSLMKLAAAGKGAYPPAKTGGDKEPVSLHR